MRPTFLLLIFALLFFACNGYDDANTVEGLSYLDGKPISVKIIDGKIDILVSNPPYVTVSEKKLMNANVTEFEPELALFVPDDDPLVFYREIIRLANDVLADNGVIWVEINEALGQETLDLFIGAGYENAILLKDIHEKDRFIKAMK